MAERQTYFIPTAVYDDGDKPLRVFTDRVPANKWLEKVRREHAAVPDKPSTTAYAYRMHTAPRNYRMSVVEGGE